MSEPLCASCAEKVREYMYRRTCRFCKYARITSAHPDDHPLAARTYCGNEDSPAFDGNVSFALDDTCGHFESGPAQFDEECLPKQGTP